MKPLQPISGETITDDKREVAKKIGGRREDWIDKVELMEKFHVSARTVDYYVAKGVLCCTIYGGNKYFYLPGITHSFDVNYL